MTALLLAGGISVLAAAAGLWRVGREEFDRGDGASGAGALAVGCALLVMGVWLVLFGLHRLGVG